MAIIGLSGWSASKDRRNNERKERRPRTREESGTDRGGRVQKQRNPDLELSSVLDEVDSLGDRSLELSDSRLDQRLLVLCDLSDGKDLLNSVLAELDSDREELDLLASELLGDGLASLGVRGERDVRGGDEPGLAGGGSDDELGKLGSG